MSNKQDKKNKDENIKKLKEEIQELSKMKDDESKKILDRIIYKQLLIKILRNIIIINILISIILIIIMSIITGENILKYNPEHFSFFYLAFLILIFDTGLGFLIAGISNKISAIYKKKSINIGFKIIILSIMLFVLTLI